MSNLIDLPPLPGAEAAGKFFITPHAVHKYQRECSPNASYNDALRNLIWITNAGKLVGDYLGKVIREQYPGTRLEMWTGPIIGKSRRKQRSDSRLRFCVAYGERGSLPQVVTVLRRSGIAR
jgi:hypothetical protein